MDKLFEPEVVAQPNRLVARRDLVDYEEQALLLQNLRRLEMQPVVMRGQASRRLVFHFGMRYDYASADVSAGEPLPEWLEPVRERCAGFAAVRSDDLAQTLVSLYPPGAGIGWHRDAAPFGSVVGLSLGSSSQMRFRRGTSGRTAFTLDLEPGSAYLLAGEARFSWQHSIPAVSVERWSITFRTLRRREENA